MDLKIFFNPLEEALFAEIKAHDSFLKSIRVNFGQMPDYQDADLVLIGITENRGTSINAGVDQAADEIRKKLYALKKGGGANKMVDLGNLRNGQDLEDTYLRLKEVCEMLINQNILPIIIGGSHDLTYAQFRTYENLDKLISVINVDAFLDMEDSDYSEVSRHHVQKLLLHQPNFLFNYSHMAYQSYLVNPVETSVMERLYFESYRIGHIRENLKEMEPVIRNADMMSFDITAIKMSDAPGNAQAQVFGLTGEEACQICWYAGLNDKLSSVGFYEYNPSLDGDRKPTASVVATMVWYFIEGYYNRKNEKGFKSNDYLRFVVSMPKDPNTLIFYKSKLSEKWWLEVPYPHEKNKYSRNCIVPCNYSDYEIALKGELPDRWIQTYAKLI